MDINVPGLQRHVGGEVEKTTCCLFCVSGPITLTAEVPRRGYCIGEIIPLTVRVDNASTKRIRVAAYLRQVATSRDAKDFESHSYTTLLRVTSETIRTRSTVWHPGTGLTVPPQTMPTLLPPRCDIITVQYILVIKAVVPRGKIPSIKIPLTIGNVPFRELSTPAPPPEFPPVISSQPQLPAHTPEPGPPSELTSDQPPSYELALQYY